MENVFPKQFWCKVTGVNGWATRRQSLGVNLKHSAKKVVSLSTSPRSWLQPHFSYCSRNSHCLVFPVGPCAQGNEAAALPGGQLQAGCRGAVGRGHSNFSLSPWHASRGETGLSTIWWGYYGKWRKVRGKGHLRFVSGVWLKTTMTSVRHAERFTEYYGPCCVVDRTDFIYDVFVYVVFCILQENSFRVMNGGHEVVLSSQCQTGTQEEEID